MKIQFAALLPVIVILAGCEAPPKAADTGDNTTATASAKPAPRLKCSPSTGSRMGSCDGATPDVQGSNGETYRDSTYNGTIVGGRPPG